jgi:septum formation protein
LALLSQIGITPADLEPANLDETPIKGELPRDHARRLARAKAEAVAACRPDTFVLAADTVVALGRRILPKAEDEATARRCLELLSGRRHAVRLVTTAVKVKRLSNAEIARYLASGEWRGKAGGYAIQGRAAAFIPAINGSYSNVVGLPLAETAALLAGLGYHL